MTEGSLSKHLSLRLMFTTVYEAQPSLELLLTCLHVMKTHKIIFHRTYVQCVEFNMYIMSRFHIVDE